MTGNLEVLSVLYIRSVGNSKGVDPDYQWPLNIKYRVVETNRGFVIQYQRPAWLNFEGSKFDGSEWAHARGPAPGHLAFDNKLDAIETTNVICFETNWPDLYYRRIDFL